MSSSLKFSSQTRSSNVRTSISGIDSFHFRNKLGFRGERKTAIFFLFGQHVLHSGTQQLYTIFVKIKKIIFQEWQKHWIFKQIIFRTSKPAQNRRNSKSLSFPHFPSSKFLNQLAATPSLELAMRSSSSMRERVPPWLLLVYFMLLLLAFLGTATTTVLPSSHCNA